MDQNQAWQAMQADCERIRPDAGRGVFMKEGFSSEAHKASAAAHSATQQREVFGRDPANSGSAKVGKALHAAAGEAHLHAAELHRQAMNLHDRLFSSGVKERIELRSKGQDTTETTRVMKGHDEKSSEHLAVMREHLGQAAVHAEAAGSEWDEDKHPRDENGRFA